MVTSKADPAREGTKAEPKKGHVEEGRVEEGHVEEARATGVPRSTEVEPHGGECRPGPHVATLRLPFLRARFEIPRAPGGGRFHLGPVILPSPGKAAYYAGLGVLAVAEVVDWPIAVAIGAGTYVAQHTRADEPALPQLEHEHVHTHEHVHEHGERREPVGTPA